MAKKKQTEAEAIHEIKNVAEAYHELENYMSGFPQVPSTLERLDEAIDRASAAGVERLAGEAYSLMLANASKMLVRAQYAASRHLVAWDKNLRPPKAPGPLPSPLAEEWLPRIERIQSHLMKIAESGAKVMHVLRIANESEAADDRGESKSVLAPGDENIDGDGAEQKKAAG